MQDNAIRDALQQAASYLREHPDEARYTDSAATAVVEAGLSVTVAGPNGETVRTDMPRSVGGSGSAPSPGWLLRAAQASCLATLIAMRAAQREVRLERLEVQVTSESDDRGILGVDDAIPAGPLSTVARVMVKAADGNDVTSIVEWAAQHCPVQDALRRAVQCSVELDVPD